MSKTETAIFLTVFVVCLLAASCVITWSVTSRGWEREAIANGHGERVLVEGSPEFAWK